MRTKHPSATTTLNEPVTTEPVYLRKKVGYITFEVSVHFSKTSNESVTNKMLRLIDSEVREIA